MRQFWWLWGAGTSSAPSITPVDPPPVNAIRIGSLPIRWNNLFLTIDTTPVELEWAGQPLTWAADTIEWR